MNHALAVDLVAHWKPRLGLADWDVRVSDDQPPPDKRAEVEGFTQRRMAVIRISDLAPDEALGRVVVHELLHIWFSQLEAATEMLMRHTPPAVDQVFTDRWDQLEHQIINALEGALTGDPHIEFGDTPGWTRPWQERPG